MVDLWPIRLASVRNFEHHSFKVGDLPLASVVFLPGDIEEQWWLTGQESNDNPPGGMPDSGRGCALQSGIPMHQWCT